MTHLELDGRVINWITAKVAGLAKVEHPSKLEGRRSTVLLANQWGPFLLPPSRITAGR